MTMAVNFELADEEPDMAPDRDEILDLLQSRDAIQGWLDRLEEQRGTANVKVLERVRADYETRLAETLDALAAHGGAIREELSAAESRLQAAREDRADADDRLEEAHLRHRIGELGEDDWNRQREEFEEAAATASQVESESAADVDRLRHLLDQLETRTPDADAAARLQVPDISPVEERVTPEEISRPREITVSDELELTLEAAVAPTTTPNSQDFLADIDRALTEQDATLEAAGGGGVPDGEGEGVGDDEEITAPKPGLKCPECGYTNDISAWFCGVCGADIG